MVFMTRACEPRRIAHTTTCVLPSETTKWERVFANREKLGKSSKVVEPNVHGIEGPHSSGPGRRRLMSVICLY